MLLLENTAALVAFIICILAFIAGYTMHNHVDAARGEWAAFTSYRQGVRHGRR